MAYARGRGGESFGVTPPLTIGKAMKTFLFGTIRFFSYRDCRHCYRVFLCYPTSLPYIISRNFHCDAITPVVKLFWCVALEPMTDSRCKPQKGQWAVLKLESCCQWRTHGGVQGSKPPHRRFKKNKNLSF